MTADSLSETAVPAAEPLTPSAGTLLRDYREALGIKPEALASKLHVPVGKLLALEQDRLDALPDAMFARALTLAVCRQLHTDPAPVLARLPQKDVSRLVSLNERGLDFPLKRPSLLPASGLRAWVAWPRWVWVGLVLTGALLIWISSSNDSTPASVPTSQVVVPLTVPVVPPVTTAPVATPDVSPAASPVVSPVAVPGEADASARMAPASAAPVVQGGKWVVTPVQPNVVVLTPVSPSISSEGASK